MSLPVVLRPEASRDAGEARDHFDSRQPGLGQAFLLRLNDTLIRIGMFPEMYGLAWQNVRAALLKKFKYVVYYLAHADRVEVIAVMFGGRDPSAWQSRA